MNRIIKSTMFLASALLLASCGLGTKITEEEFVSELSSRREAFKDEFLVSFESKGKTTIDADNHVDEESYNCTYTAGGSIGDVAEDVLRIAKWSLSDIKTRLNEFDVKLKWKYFKNDEKNAIYVSAFYGSSQTVGDTTFEYNYDFEYGFNKYGHLFHAKEYVTVPNDATPFLSDTITTNLTIDWVYNS